MSTQISPPFAFVYLLRIIMHGLLPAPGANVTCMPCWSGLAVGTPLPLRKRPGHRFVVNNSLAQRHVDSQWSGDSVGAAQLLSLLQAKRTGSGAELVAQHTPHVMPELT